MPELPWKKWFPQDWLSDPRLTHCSPATRGIWADAVSSMMLFGEDHLTGTDAYLARVCRCSEADIATAHQELEASKTGEVSIQNGYKIWVCRRIRRDLKISEIRRIAVQQRWEKRNTKALQRVNTKTHTRSASASVSESDWLEELKSDPAYVGIDVQNLHDKMIRWCKEKRQRPTRMRLINWLNKQDRQLNGTNNGHTTESGRGLGTANEGKSSQYAGVGKVPGLPNAQRPAA